MRAHCLALYIDVYLKIKKIKKKKNRFPKFSRLQLVTLSDRVRRRMLQIVHFVVFCSHHNRFSFFQQRIPRDYWLFAVGRSLFEQKYYGW